MDSMRSYMQNDLLSGMLDTILDEDADLGEIEATFHGAAGDFRTKLAAALEARMGQLARPELFIDIPEHPEQLSKGELDELVRPAAVGFLRSSPTKSELLDQVSAIARRQRDRPAWIPRVGPDGQAFRPDPDDDTDQDRAPDRPLLIGALPEIGTVTVQLPEAGTDRPELVMAPGGSGEWESALHAFLGLAKHGLPASAVILNSEANEALVPQQNRWWAPGHLASLPASEDPGVASELLATAQTLGDVPVDEDISSVGDALVEALTSVGDWRFSPRWLLETSDPADATLTLSVARAAVGAWASDSCSGLAVYVDGAALDDVEGTFAAPGTLHSYLLVATRAALPSDRVSSVHRAVLTCPGPIWCHRGGCPDVELDEAAALLEPIAAQALVLESATSGQEAGWLAWYQERYGDAGWVDAELVLERVAAALSAAGWVELSQSTWEGGLEGLLMRRGPHCLLAEYDPVTRQLALGDGRHELEGMLDLLADDGLILIEDGVERIERSAPAADNWTPDVLDAADDQLRGRISDLHQLPEPAQVTILGLHPHGDGTLTGPRATGVAVRQVEGLIAATGLA